MHDAHLVGALQRLEELRQISLRTLDALQRAVAQMNEVSALATAERMTVSAAKALKFETHAFH